MSVRIDPLSSVREVDKVPGVPKGALWSLRLLFLFGAGKEAEPRGHVMPAVFLPGPLPNGADARAVITFGADPLGGHRPQILLGNGPFLLLSRALLLLCVPLQ